MSDAWRKLKKALKEVSVESSDPPPAIPPSSGSSTTSFSRFSRSFSTTTRSSKRTCAICLGRMQTGSGQAIFTAECSHSFHFSCICNSVKHGNHLCPICRCKWKEIPFTLSTGVNCGNAGGARVCPIHPPLENVNFSSLLEPLPPISQTRSQHVQFSDDEPLVATGMDVTSSPSPRNSGTVVVKSLAELPAIAASESLPRFPVLVGIRAPSLSGGARDVERVPIDLVTLLDVSGSMSGSKLALLKQAVRFVIDNLGPSDRLAIVTFSSRAQRNFPLRRMTEHGRQDAIQAINGISANGGTNIVEGLKMGARVLDERRERNPVASIILLSDGRDTYNTGNQRNGNQNQRSPNRTSSPEYLSLLPASIRPLNGEVPNQMTFAVHTFGFGADHDSSAMHAISDASGGTFSFIESVGTVQDAFAMCIGGLLSVVAQELQLSCTTVSPGVKIVSIPSGRYANEITEEGCHGVINIGDLYADEEKEFLVYLSVPSTIPSIETSLLVNVCCYKNTASGEMVRVEGDTLKISRPEVPSPTDLILSVEVDRQKNRLAVAEAIEQAQGMAEIGNFEGAQALLIDRRDSLLSSASAQAGDGFCSRLETELNEIRERMGSEEMYERTGRAYALSGLSSHLWQRATTMGNTTEIIRLGGTSNYSGTSSYETPSMTNMVSKSQCLNISK